MRALRDTTHPVASGRYSRAGNRIRPVPAHDAVGEHDELRYRQILG
ncbi:hypothetical protein [Nocardia sp. NPDC019395]